LYYKEILRVGKSFVPFVGTLAAIALLCIAIPNSSISLGANVHPQIPIVFFFIIAGISAAILATIIGTSLAAENDDHLEVVWTLPASRLAYALRVMAVDVLGIILLFAFAVLAGLAIIYAHGFGRYLVFDQDSGGQLLRFLAYPLAWFGVSQALTASLRSKAPLYAGLAWPVAIVLLLLYEAPLTTPLHMILKVMNLINPLVYGSYASGTSVTAELLTLNALVAAGALLALWLAGSGVALAEWRRLQA